MRARSILVLDCTPKAEPKEGLLLKHFFQICALHKPAKSTAIFYSVRSKSELLKKLSAHTSYDIVHISAHGSENGIGNGFWEATIDDLMQIKKRKYKATLIHVSACRTCNKKMAEAFSSKFYLAPITDVDWVDAAAFSLLFYKRYLVDGVSMRSAFKFARRHSKTCKDYPDYWVG